MRYRGARAASIRRLPPSSQAEPIKEIEGRPAAPLINGKYGTFLALANPLTGIHRFE